MALNENLCDKAFQERTGAVMGLFSSELIELGPTGHLCYAEPKEGETALGPALPRVPRVDVGPSWLPAEVLGLLPDASLHPCSSGPASPELFLTKRLLLRCADVPRVEFSDTREECL